METTIETTDLVPTGNSNDEKKDLIHILAEAKPTKVVTDLLSNIATALCVQIIDPDLDGIEGCLVEANNALEDAKRPPDPYVNSASGKPGKLYSDGDAKKQVDYDLALIGAHEATGSTIDRRAPHWLKVAGKVAPWAELLGIAVYVTAQWNVYWLQPWQDWLSFFTALVLVIGLPLMQKFFAERAGHSHNDYCLAKYEGLNVQAHEHMVKRNWYLVGTFVVSTAGMVILAVRGIMAMDSPSQSEVWIIAAMAIIVGYGIAILAYSAIAIDGTRYSRERDELTVQGDAYAAEWEDIVDSVKADLDQAEDDEQRVIEVKFPKVLEVVRQQPGGVRDEEIRNLLPLIERAKRLETLQKRRNNLSSELARVKKDHRPAFSLNR